MPLEERKSMSSMTNVIQNIVLENREKLNISGVLDVLSFDDQIVILETELGLLTVKGENLRINKLSLDTSEVTIDGTIYQLAYSEKDSMEKGGGYKLAKSPEQYKVGDILRKTEGDLAPIACVSGEECCRKENCKTFSFWQGLDNVINEYVDSKTLADLIK